MTSTQDQPGTSPTPESQAQSQGAVPAPSHDTAALSAPASPVQVDPNQQIGMWGPTQTDATHGMAYRPAKVKRPWGGLFTLWGFLAIIASQMATIPFFIFLMLRNGDIDFDSVTLAEDLTEELTDVVLSGPGLVIALFSQWLVFFGIPWIATWRKGAKSFAKDFGFRFTWRDIPAGLGLALACQGALFLLGLAASGIGINTGEADNTGMVTDQAGVVLVMMVFAAAIMAPLSEEIFFRGLVLRSLLRSWAKVDLADPHPISDGHFGPEKVSDRRRKTGTVLAVLASTLFFGALHTPVSTDGNTVSAAAQLFLIFQTGLLGALFAVIAIKMRRIGLVIVTHLWFNSLSIALVLTLAS